MKGGFQTGVKLCVSLTVAMQYQSDSGGLADYAVLAAHASALETNTALGSLGDIDILAATADPDPLRHAFERMPGVQRDVIAAYAFWDGYDGPLSALGTSVNDAYLRLNAVEGGVLSYSRSTELLILFARTRAGSLEPQDPTMGNP